MFQGHSILALIPARGGSKGLPGKNIKELCGKPLIGWSIEAARQSAFVDRVLVTTDCEEIKAVSEKEGADVPFLRPKYLAEDQATSFDAVVHALNWLKETENYTPDFLLLLQPTSPLRTTEDIDRAITKLFEKNAKGIISVCHVAHHPWWSNTLPADGSMANFIRPEIKNKRRQDLPQFYQLNGAIYIAEVGYFIKNQGFLGSGTYAYVMPSERSVDIDYLEDFYLAEMMMERVKNR